MFLILFAPQRELKQIFEEFAGWKYFLSMKEKAQKTFQKIKYTLIQTLEFYLWRDQYNKVVLKISQELLV